MNTFYIVIYLVSFCLLVGTAFAMMYANMRSILDEMDRPRVKRHPEAPQVGDEVMYVDVSKLNSTEYTDQKQRLENLYNNDND